MTLVTSDLHTTFGHRPIYTHGETATFIPHSNFSIEQSFHPQSKDAPPQDLTSHPFFQQKSPPLSGGVLVIRYFFSMRRFAASMVSVRVPFFISTFSPWKSSPVSSSSRPPISVPF